MEAHKIEVVGKPSDFVNLLNKWKAEFAKWQEQGRQGNNDPEFIAACETFEGCIKELEEVIHHPTSQSTQPSNSCAHKNAVITLEGKTFCENCGEYI